MLGDDPFGSVSQGADGGLDVSGPEVSIERSLGGEVGRGFRIDRSGSITVKPIASMSFRPLFRVHLDIQSTWFGRPYVEYFEMRAEGSINWQLGLEVTGTQTSRGSFSLPILGQREPGAVGTFPFHVRCFSTPTVMVSVVPVWADICPKLEFEASAEVSAAIQMRATVSGQKTLGGGIRYRDGQGWLRYVNNPPATINKELSVSGSLAFKASGGLTPKANVNIWGLAGPFVAFPFGVEFESKCQPPTLNHTLQAFLAANAGVATDPQGLASWVVPKWQVQLQLFKLTYPLPLPGGLEANTVCDPGYVQLDYNPIVANDQTSRTLELDMVLEVPREAASGWEKLSNNARLRTVTGNRNAFPFATFARADCAGCGEQIAISLPIPGDYKVWAYDYENHARATSAFSRAGAKVTVNLGRPQQFTAPAGTYNRWNVATIRVDAQRRMTVIPCSSGCTQSVDLMP